MKLSDIISPEYLEEQRRLHAMPEGYGQKGGLNWAKPFLGLMLSIEGSDAKRRQPPLTVLDFGAGGGSMKRELNHIAPWLEVREFDPAVEGKTAKPTMASWVVCTDVLEHVEPDKIDGVLAFLNGLASKGLFLVISLVETAKTLSDGRQAHILLRERSWWKTKLEERWRAVELEACNPKPAKQAVFYCSWW